ncbi:MAG: GDP-mannose 4,6-dehydratase, partial [Myxococcales bacterium]|nr:GDP-mannose 4,6-dehydratase [Myxococcales bacterium]
EWFELYNASGDRVDLRGLRGVLTNLEGSVELSFLVRESLLVEPDDYVVATGEMHTVREFVDRAAEVAGFDIGWEGEAENEIGRDKKTGDVVVEVDPRFYRPAEVDQLLGDPTKAKQKLGWVPRVKFEGLVEMMMRADLELVGLG